ncbi:rhodanese-like domain-containing protein [Amphritea balenae]|uniref:Rhodanese-like domain-containing protein n=1 Tax=Amphritea balenae TaxID=452629 RepID=A0A3P1SKW1_9GAMM|nr:rhodanese-like domain-containing protein [Amphritea balenae]RRC97559.1 rhodanese-like domain-containing protein [Amphritea balenae]
MTFFKNLPDWLSWLPLGTVPSVPADKAAMLLKQCTLLDVRSLSEFNKSHIPGAISIPLYKLSKNRINQLPTDKPFICICLSAHRSKPAVRKLLKAGLDAKELEGGMLAWWKLKLPIEK